MTHFALIGRPSLVFRVVRVFMAAGTRVRFGTKERMKAFVAAINAEHPGAAVPIGLI